jgi:hypothetical protein
VFIGRRYGGARLALVLDLMRGPGQGESVMGRHGEGMMDTGC